MKTQRNKIGIILLSLLAICVVLFVIWYNTPTKLADIDKDDVTSVYIFDGTQGKGLEIFSDDDDFARIIDNLNSVSLKPTKPSLGYMGYRLRVEIFTGSRDDSRPAKTFIINSETVVRMDPFFYEVIDGKLDFQFLQELLSQES